MQLRFSVGHPDGFGRTDVHAMGASDANVIPEFQGMVKMDGCFAVHCVNRGNNL
jgi:hypothetical protein